MNKRTEITPMPIQCGIAGYVSVYKIHKNCIKGTETTKQLLKKAKKISSFKNLILNQGMDSWFINTTDSNMNTCRVGTGSSTPVETQTSLDNQIASVNTGSTTDSGNSGGVPVWYTYYKKTYTFPLGGVVGNISEVGVGTGSTVVTRALIKDSEGTPTTISITADEQLIIVYELRKYPPVDDVVGVLTIDINGVPTDFDIVIRAANVDESNFCIHSPGTNLSSASTGIGAATVHESQTLGAIINNIAGNATGGTLSQSSYVNGNFYRDYLAEFSISQGNLIGGIGGFSCFGSSAGRHGFQVSINPKIMKTSDQILSLPLRLSWARV